MLGFRFYSVFMCVCLFIVFYVFFSFLCIHVFIMSCTSCVLNKQLAHITRLSDIISALTENVIDQML